MELTNRDRKHFCILWYRDNFYMTRRQAAEYVELHVNWKNFIPHTY